MAEALAGLCACLCFYTIALFSSWSIIDISDNNNRLFGNCLIIILLFNCFRLIEVGILTVFDHLEQQRIHHFIYVL